MRVAPNDLALKSALQQAQAEAEAAFGNGGVYLEKYIEHPRHVEVQILADHHGNVVHLWERDCTVQRRHQKLIEESPRPRISPETRTAMCEAAVRLIKAAGYTNAGTVEFIVDKTRQLLLHRSQRPHPGRASRHRNGHRHRPDQGANPHRRRRAAAVSAERHRAARRGDRVPHQRRRSASGISSRRPGKIEQLIAPGGFGVRFDSHAHTGYVVSPYYDSMIGKLIVHQPTRAEAIAMHAAGLAELRSRGHQDDRPVAPGNSQPFGIRRRPHRHDVRRTDVYAG